MGLERYHSKRRFDVTPEPRGGRRRKTGGAAFVVQKHAARRLHYDFRLELDGVLKSWAVTRGPSLVPGEKRLAVHVEDHPVEYGDFEGTIPQGQYGGGTVMLWDRGRWTPEGDPHKGYAKGRLDFTLEGKKLKGRWHLVRMRKRSGEKQDPWLLIKARDEAAREGEDPDILEEADRSVSTGRSIDEIARGRSRVWDSRTGEVTTGGGGQRGARTKAGAAKTGVRKTSARTTTARKAPAKTPRRAAARAATGAAKTGAKPPKKPPSKRRSKTAATSAGKPASKKTASSKTASSKTASSKTASSKTASSKTAAARTGALKRSAATRPSAKRQPAKPPSAKRSPRKARSRTAGGRATPAGAAASRAVRGRATRSARSGGKRGRAPLPDFVPPMLATLRSRAPDGPDWLHEVKFDGYRIQARRDQDRVTLLTRKGLDWTDRFPRVAEAVARLTADTALLDGELVVEADNGVSDFAALQADLKAGRGDRFAYYAFDLLHRDGADLRDRPLAERKAALSELIARSPKAGTAIRFSEDFGDEGSLVLRQACKLTLEGIVSKRRDAPYRSARSEDWIKAKCANRQEFVVVGFADSTAMTRAVGALLVGYQDNGTLRYGGRVGTGYTQSTARELWSRLAAIETDRPPFARVPEPERRRKVHWVDPVTVIEADFRGWTGDGLLRQASFKGAREDKPAADVRRERTAVPAPAGAPSRATRVEMTKVAQAKTTRGGSRARSGAPRKTASKTSKAAARPAGGRDAAAEVEGVRLSHPERVYWEDAEVTKKMLATYYESVWDLMAPHVADRPLALLRCPEGAGTQCFFQKHIAAGLDSDRLVRVRDGHETFIAVHDLAGLIALVQAGVLELHAWGCRTDDLDRCDRIVFDLDPGEDVSWSAMVAAARDVRERLAGLKLESFVKLSGGKGLHVVLPIDGSDWDTAKRFAHTLALAMAQDEPQRYVAKMTKSLRKGRIFVDYLRNGRGATAVAAYSTRARPGASVSVPVAWDELGRIKAANQYNVVNLGRRLGALKADPWAELPRVRQTLPDFT